MIALSPGPVPNPTHRPGTALVEAAYATTGPRLHAFLTGRVRDSAAADDLTQEAFLRLFREVQAGRTPDNVNAWLYRTASNLAVSRGRRASVAYRFAPRLVDRGSAQSPEDAALDAERSNDLARALATLGEAERAAVVLAARGVPCTEIADRLGKSHVAVRTMLCRARTRLRHELADTILAPVA